MQLFWQHKKRVGEVCLYFQLELNVVGFLGILTNKNSMCFVQHVIGLHLEKRPFVGMNMSIALIWEIQSWSLLEYFDAPEGHAVAQLVEALRYK
jgi:hypothetical protein